MTDRITDRLNKILPKITSKEFLQGYGTANEIAFYIFDYPPEEELRIREHIHFLIKHFPKQKPGSQIIHINLFDFVLEYLRDRKLLGKAVEMQQKKGDDALRKALKGPLNETKLASHFAEIVKPESTSLVLLSGVGSIFPLLRSHTLLNNLHSVMGNTPLVMFYPGRYDGQSLRLFGKLKGNNYYRAFRLIP